MTHNRAEQSIYLVDFEFVGEDYNGVDLIQEFNLLDNSVLVTSRFEDDEVLKLIEKYALPMIPKATAVNLPVDVVFEVKTENIVLLDDDVNLARNISRFFEKKGQVVDTYSSRSQLNHELWRYSADTKFLIDLNVHGDNDGLDICRHINSKGFDNVNLFTGDATYKTKKEDFIKNVYIKGDKNTLMDAIS